MSPIAPEVWERLEQSQPGGRQLVARPGAPEVTEALLCAIDSQRQRHLLVVIQPDEDAFHDTQSRGLSVVTRELIVTGRSLGCYLDIECRDPAGYSALDLVGSEIAQGLDEGIRTPAEITRRVLAKWRRFWGLIPRTFLSRDEQLGLFSELWFLHIWLLTSVPAMQAVARWRGPFKARHDYEWPGKSVEVKGTTSTRGRIHWINGIEQLLPPEGGQLLFFSLRLREEAGATNSLPQIIARIRDGLQSEHEALDQFETALFQTGYSPAHDDEYAKLRLRVVEECLFSVTADFPRVTPRTMGGNPPAGVERIEYEINLNAVDHLCLARGSQAAGPHLH